MALSPNAPDYVSQVRGIIGDLRDNYLKKQQLFQDDQQAAARNALGYAQLNAQRENQALQADLDQQRIEASKLTAQANLENTLFERQRQFAADEMQRQRFEVEKQQKDLAIAEAERKRQDEIEAGRLAAMKQEAINSNDPDRILMAQAAIDNSTISGATRFQLNENLDQAMERKFKMDERLAVQQKAPIANSIISKIANLPVGRMLPEDAQQALSSYTNEFSSLNIPDQNVSNKFFAAVTAQQNALTKASQDAQNQEVSQLNLDGTQGGVLPAKYQKEYDEVVKGTDWSTRANDPNSEVFHKLRGIVAKINTDQTLQEIEDYKTKFAMDQENLVKRNAKLGVEANDPITGEKRVTFGISMPNISISDIDKRTGKLAKVKADEIKNYQNALNRAFTGNYDMIEALLERRLADLPQANNKLPFVPNLGMNASTQAAVAPAPGTTNIPVANQQPQVSPATVERIAQLYRENPNSTFNGKRTVDILANLKARGYNIPSDVLATPGQTR